MRRVYTALLTVTAVVACAGLEACKKNQPTAVSQPIESNPLSAGAHALPPPAASPRDDGNWVMPGKDYASTRFSGLNQITPANVGKLSVAFTFSTAAVNTWSGSTSGTRFLMLSIAS